MALNASLVAAALSLQDGPLARVGQRPGLAATAAAGAANGDTAFLREELESAGLQALEALEGLPTADLLPVDDVPAADPPPSDSLSDFAGRPLSQTSEPLSQRCQRAVNDMLQRDAEGAPPPLHSDPLSGVVVAPLKSSADVRIVYVIGLGPRPYAHTVITRLLFALYSPTHLFLLHADVKASKEALAECMHLADKYPNVHMLRTRRLVQWGMFTMVAITLDAIRTVLDSKARRTRYIPYIHYTRYIRPQGPPPPHPHPIRSPNPNPHSEPNPANIHCPFLSKLPFAYSDIRHVPLHSYRHTPSNSSRYTPSRSCHSTT